MTSRELEWILEENNFIAARAGATPAQCEGKIIACPLSGHGLGLVKASVEMTRSSLTRLISEGSLTPERVLIYTDLHNLRGTETAETIQTFLRNSYKANAPIFHSNHLKPRDMGELEGQEHELMIDLKTFDEADPGHSSWAVESVMEGMVRAEDFVHQVVHKDKQSEQDIVLITGNFIAACVQSILDGSSAKDHYKQPKLRFGEMRKITVPKK